MKTLTVTTTIERKHEGLPRFLCIPMSKADPWKLPGTMTVEVTLNGVKIGRRSLKRWEDNNCWFMDLSDPICRQAKVETGDCVKMTMRLASEELPEELSRSIKEDPKRPAPLGTADTRTTTDAA